MVNKTNGSVADTISDAAASVGDKASELGQKAVDSIDARRGSAASGLDSAAAGIHANADKLPPSVGPYAHQAADTLEATADYVRDNKLRDMWSDVEGAIKAYPMQTLLGAVVVGFLAGRMLRRD
jgi:hypothetical protein